MRHGHHRSRNRHRVGPTPPRQARELSTCSAWRFFVATFALSWGLGALVVTFMDQVEAWFGPVGYTNPAFILMVYSPGYIDDFPVDPWYGVLPALLPAFLIGPIEEFGWRGVALPLLQRRYARCGRGR